MRDRFIDISMLGDKELQANFKKIDIALQKKIMRQALRRAAGPVFADVKTSVPVLTYRLFESLKIRIFTKRGLMGAVVETGTRQDLGISADDPYFYPAVVEYGSQKKGIRAQPFMRPALDNNREEVFSIMRRVIKAGLESISTHSRVNIPLE